MKYDRFKYRLVFKKTYRTINGNFDGYEIYYCNGFIKTKNKIEFKSKNKRYNFYSCSLKSIDQCTGLKDKNGKLIYEDDIVKNNQNSLYSVEFKEFEHQTKFCLKRVENPDYYPHISTWQGIGYKDQKNYEVIGNIYENKELLQESEVQH